MCIENHNPVALKLSWFISMVGLYSFEILNRGILSNPSLPSSSTILFFLILHARDRISSLLDKDDISSKHQVNSLRWREYGNSCKKEFFRAVKTRHSKARITELAIPSGGQTSDPEEMLQTCHNFYKDLFTEPAPSPDDTQ
jgi:hypothetical protein